MRVTAERSSSHRIGERLVAASANGAAASWERWAGRSGFLLLACIELGLRRLDIGHTN
jgi:hypothetical protein